MYSHLTKKKKRKRLAQPRKRALYWSIQQQTIATLKKSSSHIQSTLTPTSSNTNQRDSSLKTPEVSFYTPLSLPDKSTETIQAIKQTLIDLQDQKKTIGITIDVLQRRLNFLVNAKTPK